MRETLTVEPDFKSSGDVIPNSDPDTRTIGEVTYRKYTTSRPVTEALWRVTWEFEAWHRDRLIEPHAETFDVHVRDSAACRALLAAHGFSIDAEYGDYGGSSWRDDARAGRYVFVAG